MSDSQDMKIVTKRKGVENPHKDAAILQRTLNKLRGFALIPRGVYRFNSAEEADSWMIQTIASTHALRNSKML